VAGRAARARAADLGETLFGSAARGAGEPLASRMRPRALDEVVGQQHVLGPGRPLREMLERRRVGSMISGGRRAVARPRSRASSPCTPSGRSCRSAP
jgi:putative ATPase